MKDLAKIAAAAVVAVSIATLAVPAQAAKPGMEKCYGVVKAGKNDCGTSKHACAGQAKNNGDKSEWLYVTTGTCGKLVNGDTASH